MIKHRVSLLLAAIFLFGVQSRAQVNWQKGFLVTHGDTVRGYINEREWTRNPFDFEFQKTNDSGPSRKFTIKEVSYFQVDDRVRYQRFVTLVSKDAVGLNIKAVPSANATPDTVFLEILRIGKSANLYRFRDEIKSRFFISDEAGQVKELIYQLYASNGGKYVNNEAYKNQLTFLASKAGINSTKLNWSIKQLTYGEASITKVIDQINGSTTPDFGAGKGHGDKIHFHVGAGLSINYLNYKHNVFPAQSANSLTPYFTAGIDYYNKPGVGKLLLRLGLTVNTSSFHTYGARFDQSYPQTIDYTFQQINVAFSPQVIYHLYNGAKLKFFAGAGLNVNFSSYPDNLYTVATLYPGDPYITRTPDFFQLNRVWYALQLQTGIVINRRYEVAVAYVGALQPLNRNEGLWTESLNSFRAGVSYHFIKK
jgi:hypothetical protein